jgi:hypothetical protein
MAWRRGQVFVETSIQKPAYADMIPPWEQLGYSIEKAWQAAPVEDFDRSEYTEWVRRYDNPAEAEITRSTAEAQALAMQPGAPYIFFVDDTGPAKCAVVQGGRGIDSSADLPQMGAAHRCFKPDGCSSARRFGRPGCRRLAHQEGACVCRSRLACISVWCSNQ